MGHANGFLASSNSRIPNTHFSLNGDHHQHHHHVIFWSPFTTITLSYRTQQKQKQQQQQLAVALAANSGDDNADNDDDDNDLVKKFRLEDRFGRWKFLQEFLDDFENNVPDQGVEQILFALLDRYAEQNNINNNGETNNDTDDNHNNDDESEGSRRTATPIQKEVVQLLLNTHRSSQRIPALTDSTVFDQLEQLLPNVQEDEDAFKGGWDTVLELHGAESVKVNEHTGTARWKAIQVVARVMIQYDFLLDGIQ